MMFKITTFCFLLFAVCPPSFSQAMGDITGNAEIVNGDLLSGVRVDNAIVDVQCDFRNGFDYGSARTITKTVEAEGQSHTVTWAVSSNGKPVRCGKFATGDYWIAPAPDETSYCIDSISNTGPHQDGIFLDDNPQFESLGLLPDRNDKSYGNYSADQTLTLPSCYTGDVSIVANIRMHETSFNCGTGANTGNCSLYIDVLTGLSTVPPTFGADLLRPSISENEKRLFNIYTDLDLSTWPSDSRFTGLFDGETMLDIAQRWRQTTEVFSMITLDGRFFSEGGRAFRSEWLTDDYAASKEVQRNNDLFTLFSDDQTFEEKKMAIAALLSYGLDAFCAIHICQSSNFAFNFSGLMGSGAGQFSGRLPSMALFAAFANDLRFKNALASIPSRYLGDCDTVGPQELEQLNVGEDGVFWGDGCDDLTSDTTELVLRWWSDYAGSPCRVGNDSDCPVDPLGGRASDISTGQRTAKDPHVKIDGPPDFPLLAYAAVTGGPLKAMGVQMKLIPRFEETINYPAIYEYLTRTHYEGTKTLPDPCAPVDPREAAECSQYNSRFNFNACTHFSFNSKTGIATYGPDPRDPTFKSCIHNSTTLTLTNDVWVETAAQPGDANYGQNGRFSNYHAEPINFENNSPQASNIFESLFPRNP